jgi:threonyl-tRNA synthetase
LSFFDPYRAIQATDYSSLQKLAEMAIKEKQPFERLVVSKPDLLEMFAVCVLDFSSYPIPIPFIYLFIYQLKSHPNTIYNFLSKYNKYKQYLINSKIPDGTSTTVYRCGPMIDLCVGPHIPNTGQIKAFSILKVWLLVILRIFSIRYILH